MSKEIEQSEAALAGVENNGMLANVMKMSDQQEDGSFKHYVCFGEKAPWDQEDDTCVECANEKEADKLVSILTS